MNPKIGWSHTKGTLQHPHTHNVQWLSVYRKTLEVIKLKKQSWRKMMECPCFTIKQIYDIWYIPISSLDQLYTWKFFFVFFVGSTPKKIYWSRCQWKPRLSNAQNISIAPAAAATSICTFRDEDSWQKIFMGNDVGWIIYFFCQLKIGIYVWSSINYPNSTSNYLTVIPTSKRNSGSSPTICANPKTSLATVCSVCCIILIQCLCHIVFDTAHFLLKPRSRFLVICDVTGLFGLHPFNLRYSFAGRCQVWVHLKIWNINIKYSNDIYVP